MREIQIQIEPFAYVALREFFSSNMVNEAGTDRNARKANSIMEGASIIKIELMLDYEIDWESYFKEEE